MFLKNFWGIIFAISFCLYPFSSFTQDTTKSIIALNDTAKTVLNVDYYEFVLVDGSKFIGKIDSVKKETYYISTPIDVLLKIPKKRIKKLTKLQGNVVNGEFWTLDPTRTRLFFSPTAKRLEKWEGYFSIYEIFFPSFTLGLFDLFDLSIGLSLFPTLEMDYQIFFGNIKVVPYQSEKLSVAIGSAWGSGFKSGPTGVVYTGGTYSVGNNSFTLLLGLPYEEFKSPKRPVIILGADFRTSKTFKFVTESWYYPEGKGELIISLGFRWFEKHLSADLGFVTTFSALKEAIGLPFFPWVGFAYHFGS